MAFSLFILTFAANMIIHKDCIKTTLGIWLVAGTLAFLLLRFIPNPFITYPICSILFFLMGFTIYFFRVPSRTVVPGEKTVTAVADGKIVVLEKVFEAEHLNCECIQVSIYMDFFNVHVNFWPMSGEVTYYKYHPGKYMLAFLPKASELNEHSSIAMKNDHGEILFKQLAGTFARRIVTYADSGSSVIKGEQCGIIRFGSRIDMYLPLDAEIKVKMGECVSACETVIAEMK